MADKVQLIKEWVENLKNQSPTIPNLGINALAGFQLACDDVIAFIDSLPEEPASEDLEEELDRRFGKTNNYSISDFAKLYSRKDFKNGAEWQKQQMMKDAIECNVHQCEVNGIKLDGVEILSDGLILDEKIFKDGDKVKIIIVKEGQQ